MATLRKAASFSAREFNQNLSQAKRAANNGPVFITDRGQNAYVLLNINEYQQLKRSFNMKLLRSLSMGDDYVDYEFKRAIDIERSVDLDD